MIHTNVQTIEDVFSTLGTEERVKIITHGAAFRLSDLRNRLILAQSKIEHFQAKYQKSSGITGRKKLRKLVRKSRGLNRLRGLDYIWKTDRNGSIGTSAPD